MTKPVEMSDEQLAANARSSLESASPYIDELKRRGYNVFVDVTALAMTVQTPFGEQKLALSPQFDLRITREISI